MQRLQKILQNCKTEGALFLKLVPGSTPLVGFASDELYWNELGLVDINYFSFLQSKLLPNVGPGDATKLARNEYVVPGLGKVCIIYHSDPTPSITLYLPNGFALFSRTWENLQPSESVAVPPPPPVRQAEVHVKGDEVATEILLATFEDILGKMLHIKASSLHLTAEQPYAFKVVGEMLKDVTASVVTKADLQALVQVLLPQNAKQQLTQQGMAECVFDSKKHGRFRLHVMANSHNVMLTVRPLSAVLSPFSELGIPEELKNICHLPRGLVLISGGTGSGKTTTMHAVVDYMNRTFKKSLFLFEDTSEWTHVAKNCLLTQWPMHNLSMSLLKTEPDVVFLDEVRTFAQLKMALEICEAGSLVFCFLGKGSVRGGLAYLASLFAGELRHGQYRRFCEAIAMFMHQEIKVQGEKDARAHCAWAVVNDEIRKALFKGSVFALEDFLETEPVKKVKGKAS